MMNYNILRCYLKTSRLLLITFCIFAIIGISGCDLVAPKKSFKLAIPEKDYSYNYSSKHLKEFLEINGFKIDIILADNAIEANRMVATGEADLTFVMDHSSFIPEAIGANAGNLRTIVPLFQRLFFLFSKTKLDTLDTEAEFSKKICRRRNPGRRDP